MPSIALDPGYLSHRATLAPPNPSSRSWLTAPHPTLPILATCSTDKTVRIYSLTSHTLLATISGGHKRSIRTCAWKPNLKGESVLATGSFDASVGIWRRYDTDDLNPRPIIPAATKGVDFDARDADIDNYGEEEDEDEWRFAIVLDGHESEVKSVAWSAGGNLLATCSRDKTVWIWEEVGEDDYETVAVLQEHEGDVKCVNWHPEEELVASASYDDEIRLWREDIDDWGCCAVLRGHSGTVWNVQWEPIVPHLYGKEEQETKERWMKRRESSGPRLLSCSDDLTIRVWRRRPKEKVQQNRLSILRSGNSEEDWIEEAKLPAVHTRPIYAIGWSNAGRVVSTGGDGLVVVYEERWKAAELVNTKKENSQISPEELSSENVNANIQADVTEPMEGVTASEDTSKQEETVAEPSNNRESTMAATEWIAVAQLEAAHDVFEINHVAWAPRPKARGASNSDQDQGDLIVSTGDDGVVKVWDMTWDVKE